MLLFQIQTLRAVHEQLLRLLSNQEQQELHTADAFAPFAGLNPLQYNPYTQPLWKAAVAQYDRAMSPAEQRIAGKLRNQFRGLESNSQQVFN
jgi:dynein heavy chain 2